MSGSTGNYRQTDVSDQLTVGMCPNGSLLGSRSVAGPKDTLHAPSLRLLEPEAFTEGLGSLLTVRCTTDPFAFPT